MTANWSGYESACVIDMLATIGPMNVRGMYARPFTSSMYDQAARSGITACNVTVNTITDSVAPFEDTVTHLAFWEREFASHADVIVKVRTLADLEAAKRSGRVGIILGFQDGTMFEDKPERVDLFYHLGVRVVQLTYNGRNLLGDGCAVAEEQGLTGFGRVCLERMNRLGMLVDLSHVGYDLSHVGVPDELGRCLRASTHPVAITHAGRQRRRRRSAQQARNDLLKVRRRSRAGVVGVYLMPYLRRSGQRMPTTCCGTLTHSAACVRRGPCRHRQRSVDRRRSTCRRSSTRATSRRSSCAAAADSRFPAKRGCLSLHPRIQHAAAAGTDCCGDGAGRLRVRCDRQSNRWQLDAAAGRSLVHKLTKRRNEACRTLFPVARRSLFARARCYARPLRRRRQRKRRREHTFVLVHGAWHGGWCWRLVQDRLVAAGHRVFAPTLTGLGRARTSGRTQCRSQPAFSRRRPN